MKRATIAAAVGVSALALSACATRVNYEGFEASSVGRAPLRAVAALDCPITEGALTLRLQSPSGKSCDYDGPEGESVHLTLVDLEGRSIAEALAPRQAELRTLLPLPYKAPAPISRTEGEGERTDVDLPFFHVHTLNDRADVSIFGIHIHDDGANTEVRVKKGGKHTVVHATTSGAEVLAEDIGRDNASLVYVLASDRRSHNGWRAVGYVAKGPTKGPLVVGEFRAATREGHDHHHYGDNDVERLIDRNVKAGWSAD
ncbi:MAG: hypothetical protein JSR98_15490 [Proteobacteria bacterium]|nr:hypothetical protein [Pseudomonadota bacterium]